jgi:hypothetical protein
VGTITLTTVGDASVGTVTRTWNVSDADINRLVAWAQEVYPTAPTTAVPTPPPPTPTQALNRWGAGLMQGSNSNVQRHEYEKSKAAVPIPPPIEAT